MKASIPFVVAALTVGVSTEVYAQDESFGRPTGYAGQAETRQPLETGDSVTEDLVVDDATTGAILSFPGVEAFFDPYFAWKQRLNRDLGLQLQFSFQALALSTSEDVPEQQAAAARWQMQGSWTLVDRGGNNPGTLTFRLENRYTIGDGIPPSQFGFQFGSVTPAGTGFNDFGTALTELAWRQTLLDGDLRFVFGKISASSWYNGHALSAPVRGFQNSAMQSSLTKPGPGRGLGIGLGYQITDDFVMVAGIHDANAETAGNPFDTIGAQEFYKSVEFRYYPTTPDRARYDQIRFQVWHQDALAESETPEGHGVTMAASRLFDDRYYVFGLGGVSEGGGAVFDADAAVGVGLALRTSNRVAQDLIGLGVAWGRPANDRLQEQYTSELFYRFQLVERLAITPSVQYVRHPAANPTAEDAWVFGLRARITF